MNETREEFFAGTESTAMDWLSQGALAGAIGSIGLTLSRWATWEPFSPLLIPFDVVVFVAGGAGAFLLSVLLVRRFVGDSLARASATALLVALLTSVWINGLRGTGGGTVLRLLGAAAFGGALLMFLGAVLRRRRCGWFLGWFVLFLALSLSVSLVAYGTWNVSALLFPGSVALAFAFGRPRWRPIRSIHTLLPLAISLVVAPMICTLTVDPTSQQQIGVSLRAPPRAAPSFIVIVIDTLRRDHMSVHGYERETTPNVDRWARDALIFDDATSSSSWTLPSHASMFTGLFPRTHGAHGYRPAEQSSEVLTSNPLDEEYVTLAEVLSDAGWETAAIAANHGFLAPRFHLDQGFDTYWVPAPKKGIKFLPSDWLALRLAPWSYLEFSWRYYRDRYIVDNAIRWLSAARDRPFFLFVNFMDVHFPNQRPANETVPQEQEVPLHEVYFPRAGEGNRLDPILWFESPSTGYDREQVQRFISADKPLDAAVRRDLVNNYDRELLHLDAQLGRLFQYLDETGLSATTSVLLTSDHGEYFGEHGLVFHSKHLHEEVIDVPLILKGPGIKPGRSAMPVQGVDVFPTVLETLGIPFTGHIAGRSVLGKDERLVVSEWYAAPWPELLGAGFGGRFDRDLRTVRLGNFKLFFEDNDPVELYDLNDDPREIRNLVGVRPDVVADLLARDQAWLSEQPVATSRGGMADRSEDIERLRALGYIR